VFYERFFRLFVLTEGVRELSHEMKKILLSLRILFFNRFVIVSDLFFVSVDGPEIFGTGIPET
jgi:hypothetical protein